MRPYSYMSSIIIFDAIFFKPRYLAIVSHSICSFIIIAKNVGDVLREPIGITSHRLFPLGANNTILSCASSSCITCQYSLSISTAIKYFARVSMSYTASLHRGMGNANGQVTWFNLW